MALPTSLGNGGAGLHGDDAGKVATALTALATLANEIKADHNALATKLDADAGVTDTNYSATTAIAAANVTGTATLASAGEGLVGDAGIVFARRLTLLVAIANEIRLDHNALAAKLNADATVVGTTYPVVASVAAGAISTVYGTGGTQLVGDGGIGPALTAVAAALNETKTRHNATLTALDADAGVTDTNYAATLTVAAASV